MNELTPYKKIETALNSAEMLKTLAIFLGDKDINAPKVRQYVEMALYEIASKSEIQVCTPESIIKCLAQCAQTGLAVDNRQLAYLVPFGKQAVLMPSYKGYIYKIKEADNSAQVTVSIVYQGDKFTFSKDSGFASYHHEPANAFEDSSLKMVGAYCFIKTDTGSFLETMSKKELDKIKSVSKMKSGVIWGTWEIEMFKKSIVRRIGKFQFAQAIAKLDALDNALFEMKKEKEVVTIAKATILPDDETVMIDCDAQTEENPPSEPQTQETVSQQDDEGSAQCPDDIPSEQVHVISAPQSARFWALCKSVGKKSNEEVSEYLGGKGIMSTKDIPTSFYEEACIWAKEGKK